MRHLGKTVVAVGTAVAIVACSDSGGPGGGGLSGSYTLDSLKVDTGPTLVPPLVDGSLVFGSPASFAVVLHLHPPAVSTDSPISLGGTYVLRAADSIYLNVGGIFTIPGTQAQTGTKLVLDILVPAGLLGSGGSPTPVMLAWHK